MRAAYGLSRSPAVLLRVAQTTPRRVVVGRRPTPGRLPPPPCEAPPGRRSLRTGTSRQALEGRALGGPGARPVALGYGGGELCGGAFEPFLADPGEPLAAL